MNKNKYAYDFKKYMYENIKRIDDFSSILLNVNTYNSAGDISSISLDIWDNKVRLNSKDRYDSEVSHVNRFRNLADSKPQSVLEFANDLKLPLELLIETLDNAGIHNLKPETIISESKKTVLLEYLRKEYSAKLPKMSFRDSDVRRKRVLLYEGEIPPVSTQILLEEINDKLLFFIAKNPEIIYQLGSRKFEELIAKLFSDSGHEVSLTKSTRDGGYDIFARVKDKFSEFIILAECKKYNPNNKVGIEVVRGLYGVTEAHRANQGLIVTSSFFTKDAQLEQLRIGSRIGLKDYNDLVDWIKPYSKAGN